MFNLIHIEQNLYNFIIIFQSIVKYLPLEL